MNYFNIIKSNWKKTLFGTGVFGYGIYYTKSEYDISQHMKTVCNKVCIADTIGGTPKRVLVIMNPIANKKRSENMFKKYCEPILHLAGYSVEILKTSYVGHAKTLIENIKVLPDAIVIAGGDGTSSEVITGLMRRPEKPCPIAIIPLGRKSETASKYLKFDAEGSKLERVKSLTNSILPMIEERVLLENVIKFDVLADQTESDIEKKLKPIYGLDRFSWGLIRDIESIKDKYWYFGNLRYHAAALLNAFSKNLSWKFSTNYVYTPPCPGCRLCIEETEPPAYKSYFRNLLPLKTNAKPAMKSIFTNVNCNIHTQGQVETNQLNIVCKKNEGNFYELETKFINNLKPGVNFIKNIQKITQSSIEPSLVLKSRTIELVPTANLKEQAYYTIDGEEYDVRPIKVSIIPKAIKIFC